MDYENTSGYVLLLARQCHLGSCYYCEERLIIENETGVSTFADNPTLIGPDHLEPLLKHALSIVPKNAIEHTPIFLLATAGMRLLPEMQQRELLAQICSYTHLATKFLLPDCDLHIQVISGETEGLYGWIAANYLLGSFDAPEAHVHGKGHHTYGFLDMGGASAQIAFAPNATEAERHANDLKLLRMRTNDGVSTEYRVFVTTWLGFGVNQARRRYVDALLEESLDPGIHELPDPCLPAGLAVTKQGGVIRSDSKEAKGRESILVGTGRFDECLRRTYPLLDKDAPCEDQPCLLHGVHVPAIDFDVNHFVGVSEYWHTTHEIFEMSYADKTYDFNTYQTRVRDFCSQDWDEISKGLSTKKWGGKVDETTAVEVCFKASWLINMLHDGIGIPRVGLEDTRSSQHNGTKEVLQHAKEKGYLDPFQSVDKIKDTEVSWTLGKMILYASSQVPPPADDALPVGFGGNVPGVPVDFQFAGSDYAPLPDSAYADDGDDDWHDKLLNSKASRRIPGFILFILILCIAVYFLYGRDRRKMVFQRMKRAYRRGRDNSDRRRARRGKIFGFGNSRHYDRVLEDGDAARDFELDQVDSDGHSDSSDGSRVGRSSGWATPRVPSSFENASSGYFDVVSTQGVGSGFGSANASSNAIDRSGVVVRTESRERLAAGSGNSDKRSRNGSPSRLKSPLPTPFGKSSG
ncbi:MAG: hypothetical protein M1819_001304 [Sarea resinae]|nr:MAG: hypothetical protein M1819_001304 [Sarea resinae]